MNRADIENELRDRFLPEVAADHDVVMALEAPDMETIRFAISPDAGIHFDSRLAPDVTLLFDCMDTALGIVRGTIDPIAAFMDGAFRSDGYLVLVFVFVRMFRKGEVT